MAENPTPLRITEHSLACWMATFRNPPLDLFDPESHAGLWLECPSGIMAAS